MVGFCFILSKSLYFTEICLKKKKVIDASVGLQAGTSDYTRL